MDNYDILLENNQFKTFTIGLTFSIPQILQYKKKKKELDIFLWKSK